MEQSKQSREDGRRVLRALEWGIVLTMGALVVSCAFGEELPETPEPVALMTTSHTTKTTAQAKRDYLRDGLLTGVLLARTADWISTQQCVRDAKPIAPKIVGTWKAQGCQEKELPAALAGSKIGLAAFELGMFSGEVALSNHLASHHHRRLAVALDAVSFALTAATDAHNYAVAHKSLTREK
jgi:hypothetical protein